MSNEQLTDKSLIQKIKSIFWKESAEDKTNAELDEKLAELDETGKVSFVNDLTASIVDQFNAAVEAKAADFAAKLKEETDLILVSVNGKIDAIAAKIDGLESTVNAHAEVDVNAEIAKLRTEIGEQFNAIKEIKQAAPAGDQKEFGSHKPGEGKKVPPVAVWGSTASES